MAAKTPEDKKRIMEIAGLNLRALTAMDQVLDWYAGLFATLGARALGEVIMGERKRRDDAKADRQRRDRERAKEIHERNAAPKGYTDEQWANRGQPQKGARGTWSQARKDLEQAHREIDWEEAEGITFPEGEGERARPPKVRPKILTYPSR